jgi:hypothetical protein
METKTLTTCNGRINQNGICDTCYQPALTSSGQCIRLIETRNEPAMEKEPELPTHVDWETYTKVVNELKADIEERIEAASLSNKDKRYLADRIIELQNENQKLREALTEIRNDLDDVGAYDGTISRDTRDKLDTILGTKAKNV